MGPIRMFIGKFEDKSNPRNNIIVYYTYWGSQYMWEVTVPFDIGTMVMAELTNENGEISCAAALWPDFPKD